MIRFFDFLLSIIGLLLLAPLIFIIALAIKINSKGSIFYKQKRIGKGLTNFNLIKFRTMFVHSDRFGLITVGMKDPRITKIGQFLRKYKLDEIPQLFNVLKGEMSIVGPRPEVKEFVDLYSSLQKEVLKIKPGITDYASIVFSNENEILGKEENPNKYYIEHILPEKIKLNMIYITHYNLKSYFKIIILTIFKIIFPNKRIGIMEHIT